MSAHDEAIEKADRAYVLSLADVQSESAHRAGVRAAIRAYLAHMAAAGWKLTRREATEGMAISALDIPTECPVSMREWLVEMAKGEWSAMHDAAPSPEEAP